MAEIDKRLKSAIEIAKKSGEILKANFRKNFSFRAKKDHSLVSDIDLKAEKKVVSMIKKNFPEDGIVTEESEEINARNRFFWIIDPLDGTHNYIKGIDIFGTSIAVCESGCVMAGVICLPMSNRIYWARQGLGAFCNGRRISVSKRKMKEATMFFDSSLSKKPEIMFPSLKNLSDKVFNIRMLGSTVAGLCSVAEGLAECEVEFCDRVWDFAAGLLIIEEAGGVATDLTGGKWDIDMVGYAVSNGIFHKKILKEIVL
ncbi:MAG: inositol monophosphatase [Elusimicrobia bacterium]|nr:inositol monophosphatase [Elusimicrobiota bacterium]